MSENAGSDAPSLTVSGGPCDGRVLTLERSSEVVLGSGANCHLRLDLANVNSDHAYITWEETGVVITDYGSSTGTYVNGEKIGENHPLADGDRLFLGPPGSKESAKLLFRIPESALRPAEGEAEVADEAEDTAPSFDSDAEALVLIPSQEPESVDFADEPLVLEEKPVASVAPPAPLPPVSTPPPPAAAPSAPTPLAEPPTAAKPAEARSPSKPDYADEMPSISVPDRRREPVSLPPAAAASPRPRPAPTPRPPKGRIPNIPKIPRLAGIGGIAAAVGIVGFLVFRWLQTPPPVITSISPPKAEVGQAVSINGTSFVADASKVVVRIGNVTAPASSATETTIVAAVPPMTVLGGAMDVPVTVETRAGKSNALFVKAWAPPKITSIEPDVAMPGDTVVAKGQNLKGDPLSVQVGQETAPVESADPESIRFRIPDLPRMAKSLPVTVRVGSETSKPTTLLLGRLPLVLETAPSRVVSAERLTIRGRGFDAKPANNSVSLAGVAALVLQASANEVTVIAPSVSMAALTTVPVTVTVAGKTSSGDVTVNVGRPGASFYLPRFFPAPPPPDHATHDHALVATELGPFLVLSGKSDAPSTAERAERTASALNLLFESALAGKPVALEQRDKPGPSVAVAGSETALITATAADSAGYAEAWDPTGRSSRLTANEIATYWKAQIDDYLALFVQRQRPAKVIELSARGKVLSDLYAEAVRSGGTVSVSAVSPMSAARKQAFREMALLPSVGQGPRAAASIEGRWLGSMVEGDAGEKAIEVRFRLEGTRLDGLIVTRSGGLSMEIPIKDASYQRGTLRFAVPFRGATRYFVATLAGDTLDGSMHNSADSRETVGRFSLKYLQ